MKILSLSVCVQINLIIFRIIAQLVTKKQIRLNVRNIKRGIYAHYISVK